MTQATETLVIDQPREVAKITFPCELAHAKALSAKYADLTIAGVDDKAGFEACNKARLDLKRLRVSIEKRKKDLNEDALKWQREVNATAKTLIAQLEATEAVCEKKLKVITDERQRLFDEKITARMAALRAVRSDMWRGDVEKLSDEEWAALIAERVAQDTANRKAEEEKAQAVAAQAEQDRKDREELKRQKEELKRQKEELDRREAEQATKSQTTAEAPPAAPDLPPHTLPVAASPAAQSEPGLPTASQPSLGFGGPASYSSRAEDHPATTPTELPSDDMLRYKLVEFAASVGHLDLPDIPAGHPKRMALLKRLNLCLFGAAKSLRMIIEQELPE